MQKLIKRNIIFFSLFFMLLLIQPSKAIDISDCATLNSAGSTYDLTTDLIDKSGTNFEGVNTCFIISANYVTLDCHNHLVDSVGGIRWAIAGKGNYTTIRNCRLSDWWVGILPWAKNIIYRGGVHHWNVSNIYTDPSVEYGYYGRWSEYGTVTDSVLEEVTFYGSNRNSFDNVTMIDLFIYLGNNNNIYNSFLGEVSFVDVEAGNNFTYNVIQDNNCIWSSDQSRHNTFYNNVFNCTTYWTEPHPTTDINFNITPEAGDRIYSDGALIGGNYWTNPTGTGYSDTCIDTIGDGFCDSPYSIIGGTDYYPYSIHYVAPFSCGDIGLRTDNVGAFFASVPGFIMDMIICIQPVFIILFGLGIASVLVLIFKHALK
jgi:hypothetical protein